MLGWISVALLVVIAFVPVVPNPARAFSVHLSQFEVLLGFGIYCLLCLVVGAAVRRCRTWARFAGAGLSIFSLPYFPIGTFLGIAAIVYLVRGWRESSEI